MRGTRQSKTFDKKAEAVEWATHEEAELMAGRKGGIPKKPFTWLLNRYVNQVSPTKKTRNWEERRIAAISRLPIARMMLPDIRSRHIAQWRDERLKVVSPASVNREWNLLSNVFTVAINEWELMKEHPMKKVKRPPATPHRDRRITPLEIRKILAASGYRPDIALEKVQSRVGAAFLFAIETAMRAGEIIKLTPSAVDLGKRVAKLEDTKNGSTRFVPLSSAAIHILRQLPPAETCFNLSTGNLDGHFQKAKERSRIKNLHFHDTRHEAITRLAKKLHPLDLARMVGHRDLKQLMVYYNASAEELARKLK